MARLDVCFPRSPDDGSRKLRQPGGWTRLGCRPVQSPLLFAPDLGLLAGLETRTKGTSLRANEEGSPFPHRGGSHTASERSPTLREGSGPRGTPAPSPGLHGVEAGSQVWLGCKEKGVQRSVALLRVT